MSAAERVASLIAPAGAALSESQIASCAENIARAGGAVARISRIDERAADLFFTGNAILSVADLPFDIIVQAAASRCKKILIADMESTIIEQEMLDELAGEIGLGEKTAEITRRAMNGELDFAAALAERVAQLKGQPQSLIDHVAGRMTLMPGAQALLAAMKGAGAHCWLVSGGFTCFVKPIADRLGFNRFFANSLIIENGVLTGKTAFPVLDKNSKRAFLEQACSEYGCNVADTLAVGDGANDVPMLQASEESGGFGIAFRAKPKVRELIHNQVNRGDLSALIYAQGLK